ncbi:DUF4411 family protein [Ralstonia pseudosolanacearum]
MGDTRTTDARGHCMSAKPPERAGNADTFVVARAYAIGGTVVTAERLKPNAVKVPNICAYLKSPVLISTDSWKAKAGS